VDGRAAQLLGAGAGAREPLRGARLTCGLRRLDREIVELSVRILEVVAAGGHHVVDQAPERRRRVRRIVDEAGLELVPHFGEARALARIERAQIEPLDPLDAAAQLTPSGLTAAGFDDRAIVLGAEA